MGSEMLTDDVVDIAHHRHTLMEVLQDTAENLQGLGIHRKGGLLTDTQGDKVACTVFLNRGDHP